MLKYNCLRRAGAIFHSAYSSTTRPAHCPVPYISAYRHKERLAVSDIHGQHTYLSLLKESSRLAKSIKQQGRILCKV